MLPVVLRFERGTAGFFMAREAEESTWVGVLLDWQNIYRCAREAFGLEQDPAVAGSADALKLARHLAGCSGEDCRLQEVRIYRGRPDNAKDPKGYSAWRSQTAAWKRAGGDLVIERYRDLKYRGQEVMEKGIDVWLAVDLIYLAMDQGADRAVVFSTDTDLLPAVELAKKVRGADFVEVAGWDGPYPSAALLDVPDVTKHRLKRPDYERLHDPTDYNLSVRVRRKSDWEGQIQAEGRRRRP
jgi:uncharacterized LabA/DUF88 family protein